MLAATVCSTSISNGKPQADQLSDFLDATKANPSYPARSDKITRGAHGFHLMTVLKQSGDEFSCEILDGTQTPGDLNCMAGRGALGVDSVARPRQAVGIATCALPTRVAAERGFRSRVPQPNERVEWCVGKERRAWLGRGGKFVERGQVVGGTDRADLVRGRDRGEDGHTQETHFITDRRREAHDPPGRCALRHHLRRVPAIGKTKRPLSHPARQHAEGLVILRIGRTTARRRRPARPTSADSNAGARATAGSLGVSHRLRKSMPRVGQGAKGGAEPD